MVSDGEVRRTWGELSKAEQLALGTPDELEAFFASLTPQELEHLQWDWSFWARPKQMTPPGEWSIWYVKAGRGFGKTRTGTGWFHARALEEPRWMALVNATPDDVERYQILGTGGILDKAGKNIAPHERPIYEPSKGRLTWPNGSWASIYSAANPEALRGFSGDTAWLDELGKYKNQQEVWDNLQMGMREASSDRPRRLITTTPRPTVTLNKIQKLPGCIVTKGSSYDNRANLDPTYYAETIQVYEGTKYGRQEIHAEDLDPEEAGVIKRTQFRLWPHHKPLPEFVFIIVSLDTAFTEKQRDAKKQHEPDDTACGVWGVFIPEESKTRVHGQDTVTGPLNIMCLDAWEEQLGFPDLLTKARAEMKRQWGRVSTPVIRPLIGPAFLQDDARRADILLIENKGSGISLRQTMAGEGVPCVPYNPGNMDKLQRLYAASPAFAQGQVWVVESNKPQRAGQPMKYYETMISQVCTFAGEGSIEKDDHVDQTSQAVKLFIDKFARGTTRPKEDRDADALEDAENEARQLAAPRGNPYSV